MTMGALDLSAGMPMMASGPMDSLNYGASGSTAGLQGGGLSDAQRMMLAKALMSMGGGQKQRAPMLNLGNVQGNLPGGGVSSPYGVV